MINAVKEDMDTSIIETLSWHAYFSLAWVVMLELPLYALWVLLAVILSKLETLFCLLAVPRKLLLKHRLMWSCLIRHWLSICKKSWLDWKVSWEVQPPFHQVVIYLHYWERKIFRSRRFVHSFLKYSSNISLVIKHMVNGHSLEVTL